MSEEFDWGDDPFDSEMSFDDDFDSPRPKGKLKSFVTGFLQGAADTTYGDTRTNMKTLGRVLPKSFKPLFSNVAKLEQQRLDLVREIKSNTHEGVVALQSIAKASKDKAEKYLPNKISEGIETFSKNDFSDWADPKSSTDDSIRMEATTDEDVNNLVETVAQSGDNTVSAISTIGDSINQTIAQTTGHLLGSSNAIATSVSQMNRTLQDVVSYQMNVQSMHDKAKISLLARQYTSNAQFYKFMEKAQHRAIQELKAINQKSGLSDFEKTSTSQFVQQNIRQKLYNSVVSKSGGVREMLTEKLGKDSRAEKYDMFNSLMSNVGMGLTMSEGMDIDMFNVAGGMAGEYAVNELIPKLLKSGWSKKRIRSFIRKNPTLYKSLKSKYSWLDDVGGRLGYLTDNVEGLTNLAAQNTSSYEAYESQDLTYEDYVNRVTGEGKKPLPKAVWWTSEKIKGKATDIGNRVTEDIYNASGTRISSKIRRHADLAGISQWTLRNDLTLNEVIPMHLANINLSLEKIRTGNNNLTSDHYDLIKGKMIGQQERDQNTLSHVFAKNEITHYADSALGVVDKLDTDGALQGDADLRAKLAMLIARNQDKSLGFSPFSYVNLEKEGFTKAEADKVRVLMMAEWGITQDDINQFNSGSLGNVFDAVMGVKDIKKLNEVSEQYNSLGSSARGISERFDEMKNAGNTDALRRTGILNPDDSFNNDMRWKMMEEYARGNKVDFDNVQKMEERSKSSFNNGGFNSVETPKSNQNSDQPTAIDYSVFRELNESIKQLDFSKLAGNNFGTLQIPLDKINTNVDIIAKNSAAVKALLEKVSKEGITTHVGITKESKKATDEAEVQKQGILERIKGFGSSLFGGGMDKLLKHDPLILGGLLGGLAATALHDPKTALLIGGVSALTVGYMKFHDMAKARGVYDTEDIYEEGAETPLLEAERLRRGEYFCAVAKKVLTSWKEIAGAVVTKTGALVASAAQLAKKLWTSTGKPVLLQGLNKGKELLFKAFRWIDPIGRLSGIKDNITTRYKQSAVYLRGESGVNKTPVLTRKGFQNGEYFDANGNPVTSWEDIKGPVFNKEMEPLITQTDYDNGLCNIFGVSLDTTKSSVGKAATWLKDKFGMLRDKVSPAAKRAAEAAKNAFNTDLSPVVNSVDRIYHLLNQHWGYPPNPDVTKGPTPSDTPDVPKDPITGETPETPTSGNVTPPKDTEEKKRSFVNKVLDPFGVMGAIKDTITPKGKEKKTYKRENSFEDLKAEKEEKEDKEYKRSFMDMVKGMAGFGGKKEEKEKKGGLFSLLTTALGFLPSIAGTLLSIGGTLVSGIAAIVGALGGSWIPSFGGDDKLTPEQRKQKKTDDTKNKRDNVKANNKGKGAGRFMKGGKMLGAGLALGYGVDALKGMGVVEEGGLVDDVSGVASTALGVAGAWGMANSVLGMGGYSVGGLLMSGLSGLAGVISAPVLLGGAAVAAAAYGGYKLYKHLNKAKLPAQIRMAQYGVADVQSELAERIFNLERFLEEYVVVKGTTATLTEQTDIEGMLTLFLQNPNDKKEVNAFLQWFTYRFKPVFLNYCGTMQALDVKGVESYDSEEDVIRYRIAKEVQQSLKAITPSVFSVNPRIDKDIVLLDLTTTNAFTENLYEDWKEALGDKLKTDNVSTVIKGGSKASLEKRRDELRAIAADDRLNNANYFERRSTNNELREVETQLNALNHESVVKFTSGNRISIADLVPEDSALDTFTALRVGMYGVGLTNQLEVEAVLYLERYCEQHVTISGKDVSFKKSPIDVFGEVQSIFGNSVSNRGTWINWFNARFLPTFLAYVSYYSDYGTGAPGEKWKKLSDTAKYKIAKALTQTQSLTGRRNLVIETTGYSAFKGGIDGDLRDRINAYLAVLEEKSSKANLLDPTAEAKRTNTKSYLDRLQETNTKGGATEYTSNTKTGDSVKTARDALLAGRGGKDYTYERTEYKPVKGNTDTKMLDYGGVKTAPGNDTGVSVPQQLAEQLIIKEMLARGFTDPREIALVLANCYVETGGFNSTAENLKYTDPKRLVDLFSEIKTIEQARSLMKAGPVALANTIYGGAKGVKLGNTEPNDGWNYRGGGFIQLTGKGNYKTTGDRLGLDLVGNPKLAREDPNIMAKIAVDYYANSKRMRTIKDNDNFAFASQGVNKNLPDMDKRFGKYKDYLTGLIDGELTPKGTPEEERLAASTTGAIPKTAPYQKPTVPMDGLAAGPEKVVEKQAPPATVSKPGVGEDGVPNSLAQVPPASLAPSVNVVTDNSELKQLLAGGIKTSDTDSVVMLGNILQELRKLNEPKSDPLTVDVR